MEVKKAKNVKTEHKVMIAKMVKVCLREMAKKEYEIPATVKQLQSNCCVYVKNICNQTSNFQKHGTFDGKRNKIVINVNEYVCGLTRIHEYDSFKDHPVIGTVENVTPESNLWATVAHEVAHYIQYEWGPKTRYLMKTYQKSHGKGFQTIYRYLRQAVVNPRIVYVPKPKVVSPQVVETMEEVA